MKTAVRALPLLLAACVLSSSPEGDVDELAFAEQALLPTLPAPQPPSPTPGPSVLDASCAANPMAAPAQFVVPGSGACPDVAAAGGSWEGELAFPGVIAGLCRYTWMGAAPTDYAALEVTAAWIPDVRGVPFPAISADCRAQTPPCSSVASCEAAAPAERVFKAGRVWPGTSPCPACKGTVDSGKLVAVITPHLAQGLVLAKFSAQGGPQEVMLDPKGSQVIKLDLREPVSATSEVAFERR